MNERQARYEGWIGKTVIFGGKVKGTVEAVNYWRGDYRLSVRLENGRIRFVKAILVDVRS